MRRAASYAICTGVSSAMHILRVESTLNAPTTLATMKNHPLIMLATLGTRFHFGDAQALSYVTDVVTECDNPTETEMPLALGTAAAQLPNGGVAYSMPACECGCHTCTLTSVYTTAFPIFCSTGLSPQPYTITETYVGMSTLPTFGEPTSAPYGFTVAEETCTMCGGEPLATAMTYPYGGTPYDAGLQSLLSSPDDPVATGSASPETAESAARVADVSTETSGTETITKTLGATIVALPQNQSTGTAHPNNAAAGSASVQAAHGSSVQAHATASAVTVNVGASSRNVSLIPVLLAAALIAGLNSLSEILVKSSGY
jgi:hypothetical protein